MPRGLDESLGMLVLLPRKLCTKHRVTVTNLIGVCVFWEGSVSDDLLGGQIIMIDAVISLEIQQGSAREPLGLYPGRLAGT